MHNLTWTTYRTVHNIVPTLDELYGRLIMGCLFDSIPDHAKGFYPIQASIVIDFSNSFPIVSRGNIDWSLALETAKEILDQSRGTWEHGNFIFDAGNFYRYYPETGSLCATLSHTDLVLVPAEMTILGVLLYAMSILKRCAPKFLYLTLNHCFMDFKDQKEMRKYINSGCQDFNFHLVHPVPDHLDVLLDTLKPTLWELVGYDQKVEFETMISEQRKAN